jgi:uncharacterized membrane protein
MEPSMSLYTILKFLHVLSAAVWFGGGLVATVLGVRAAKLTDHRAQAALRGQLEGLGQAVFGPAAGLTLLTGIATALAGGISMTALWILWGYGGVAVSMVLGGAVGGRTGKALLEASAADGPSSPRAVALDRRMLQINLLGLAVLLSVIWAMVAKPTL